MLPHRHAETRKAKHVEEHKGDKHEPEEHEGEKHEGAEHYLVHGEKNGPNPHAQAEAEVHNAANNRTFEHTQANDKLMENMMKDFEAKNEQVSFQPKRSLRSSRLIVTASEDRDRKTHDSQPK